MRKQAGTILSDGINKCFFLIFFVVSMASVRELVTLCRFPAVFLSLFTL
jgi:hypothetical protein